MKSDNLKIFLSVLIVLLLGCNNLENDNSQTLLSTLSKDEIQLWWKDRVSIIYTDKIVEKITNRSPPRDFFIGDKHEIFLYKKSIIFCINGKDQIEKYSNNIKEWIRIGDLVIILLANNTISCYTVCTGEKLWTKKIKDKCNIQLGNKIVSYSGLNMIYKNENAIASFSEDVLGHEDKYLSDKKKIVENELLIICKYNNDVESDNYSIDRINIKNGILIESIPYVFKLDEKGEVFIFDNEFYVFINSSQWDGEKTTKNIGIYLWTAVKFAEGGGEALDISWDKEKPIKWNDVIILHSKNVLYVIRYNPAQLPNFNIVKENTYDDNIMNIKILNNKILIIFQRKIIVANINDIV